MARGLAVPGMPIGGSGHGRGSPKQRYDVLLFDGPGKTRVLCLAVSDSRQADRSVSATADMTLSVEHADERDIAAIVALNNLFAPDGLTLMRFGRFRHGPPAGLSGGSRRGIGAVLGCVALDEYSPSLVELVSLAVAPAVQGRGIGRRLILAAEELARQRGYPEVFAVSLADQLFLSAGFRESSIVVYPRKDRPLYQDLTVGTVHRA